METFPVNALQLSSFAMSSLAMVFALFALFPALKFTLRIVRDAVLWLAVFFIIGGGAFFAFTKLQAIRTGASMSFAGPMEPLSPGFTSMDTSNRR